MDISTKSLDKQYQIAINPDNSVNDRKAAYAEFQSGVVKHNVMVNDHHDIVDEIMALGEDLNSAEETIDLLNRSYNQSKIIQANFIGWGADMAAGALSVADDAVVNLAGVTNDALNMLLPVNIGLPGSFEMWEHDTEKY